MSSKTGGTGLGSKIVKDVVDMHGGASAWRASRTRARPSTSGLPIEGPAFLRMTDTPAADHAEPRLTPH